MSTWLRDHVTKVPSTPSLPFTPFYPHPSLFSPCATPFFPLLLSLSALGGPAAANGLTSM